MRSFQIAQLKQRKNAYICACNLVSAMRKYSYNECEQNEKELKILAGISEGLPLPSGRWGNAIALALEINDYIAAKLLIENAEDLNLETATVVSEFGGNDAWSLKDEYLFSQLTYEYVDSNEDIKNTFKSEDDYNKYVGRLKKNNEANKSLEKLLKITKDEIQFVKKH